MPRPATFQRFHHAALTVISKSTVTKQDIEEHFSTHGSGKITEIKLMNGFGFVEYEDAMDARDVVPGKSENLMAMTNMKLLTTFTL